MDNLKFYEGKKIVSKKRMDNGEVYSMLKNEARKKLEIFPKKVMSKDYQCLNIN